MPLNTVAKANSTSSNTPSKVITRQEVSMGKPSASSARVQALKARLTGQPPSQPVVPRPMGSTARREQAASLNKFTTNPQYVTKTVTSQSKTSARSDVPDFNTIAPPPSGLAPGSEYVQQAPNSIEAPAPSLEASKETVDPQFAALARQAQQLRKAQQKLKADQEAWKQQQAEFIPKSRLSSETLKVLSEAGITPDKLVELQTNQAETADPNQPLLDRISQLENKIVELTDPTNGTLAKRDQEAYSAAVKQITADAKLLVDSNPTYGTIKSENKISDVVELVTRVFDEEGIVLDVEEAATLVENKLVERLYSQYERISQYDKIKARLGKQAEVPAEANTTKPASNQQSKTLTNAGSAQTRLSPRDRAVLKVQEAMEARKGR